MDTRMMADPRDAWRNAGLRFDSCLVGAEQMRGDIEARAPLPCDAQTAAFVADWMQRHAAPGTVVVVRHAQLGLNEYLLDEVRRIDSRLKRIYLADHGVFRLNGDYLAPPRGRFGLLAPVDEVLAAAMTGQTWMNGQAAFRRPHSAREHTLIAAVRRQQDRRDRLA